MSEPRVTVVLRSYNEGWALQDTLSALRRQDYGNWEWIAFDSGSTDGSIDLIQAGRPKHFIQLLPTDYRPGRVLNQAMDLAATDLVVFLNADATPQNAQWLRPLVGALQDPSTAAAFGRQVPRPDCRAVFAADYERCFGPRRESARWDHFFSMVSSGLRKEIWARRGFLETLQYSEDDEYTRWAAAQGYRVVYCPDSVVMHSHNYTPDQAFKRSFGGAWALAATWRQEPDRVTSRVRLLLGRANDIRRDLQYCHRTERLAEWPQAARIRWEQRLGRRAGFRAGRAMHGRQASHQTTRRGLTTAGMSQPTAAWPE